MSSSRSKSRSTNTTKTVDQRTTETLNAGVGGDVEDSVVFSGVDGDVNHLNRVTDITDFSDYEVDVDESVDFEVDNSVTDFSEVDNSLDASRTSWDDYDNSVDNSSSSSSWDDYDNSVSDGSTSYRNVQGGVNITDGGAFSLAEKVMTSLVENQSDVFNSANALAGQSMSELSKIKAGETTAKAANKDLRNVAVLGGVAVAGFTIYKVAERMAA